MTEDSEHIKFSRRSALKKAAGISIAATLAVTVGKELVETNNQIDTRYGTFIPIYERHGEPLVADQIPSNVGALFLEVKTREYLPVSRMLSLLSNWDDNKRIISDDAIEKVAKNNGDIIFGDIIRPEDNSTVDFDKIIISTFGVGAMATVAGLATDKKHMSRRRFLMKSGAAIAGWTTSNVGLHIAAINSELNEEEKSAADRVFQRMAALSSHLHPELTIAFFRNLKFALSLHLYAQTKESETHKKQTIAFNVGGLHQGVEDFLVLGPDFCRNLLLAYPSSYLEKATEINPEGNLYSIRVADLPSDFIPGDLEDYSKSKRINEIKIVDQKLKEGLEKKLGHAV